MWRLVGEKKKKKEEEEKDDERDEEKKCVVKLNRRGVFVKGKTVFKRSP